MNHKQLNAEMAVTEGEHSFVATITSAVTDRDREVLLPEGMRSKDFEKNPVIYWNHDYSLPPIGQAVSLRRNGDRWHAKGVLAERPENHPEAAEWLPDTIHALMQQKVIRGVSVGFDDTVKWRQPTAKDREQYGDKVERVATSWDLLEFSIAPLMANQEALISAVSKGICTENQAKTLFGLDDLPKRPKKTVLAILRPKSRPKRVDIPSLVQTATAKALARREGRIFIATRIR